MALCLSSSTYAIFGELSVVPNGMNRMGQDEAQTTRPGARSGKGFDFHDGKKVFRTRFCALFWSDSRPVPVTRSRRARHAASTFRPWPDTPRKGRWPASAHWENHFG